MASLGSLVASLELQSASFNRGLDRSAQQIRSFQRSSERSMQRVNRSVQGVQREFGRLRTAAGALAGALAIRQFGRFTRQALDAAGGLGELAQSAGVTTKQLQELEFAAVQAGVSQGELVSGLQRLARRVGEAAKAKGTLNDIVKQYGISIRDAGGQTRGVVDILGDLADVMANAESEAEAVRIATQALGRSGANLVPILIKGREGLEQWAEQANAVGAVLSEELIAKADRASDTLGSLEFVFGKTFQVGIVESFGAAVSDSTDLMERASAAGRRLGEVVGATMNGVARAAEFAANNLNLILGALAGIAAAKAATIFLRLAAALKEATTAMLALNAAALANPIGLVATAIGAAVAALVIFRNSTITIGETTFTVGNLMGAVWTGVSEAIAGVAQSVFRLIEALGKLVLLDFEGALQSIQQSGEGLARAFNAPQAAFEAFQAAIRESNADTDIAALQGTLNNLLADASNVAPGINDITDSVDRLGDAVKRAQLDLQIASLPTEEAREFAKVLSDLGVDIDVIDQKNLGRVLFVPAQNTQQARELQAALEAIAEIEFGREVETFGQDLQRQLVQIQAIRRAAEESAEAERLARLEVAIANELHERGIDLLSSKGQEQARILRQLDEENRKIEETHAKQSRAAEAQRRREEELRRQSEEAARLIQQPFLNAIDGIQGAFTNAFENIFSGGVNSFKDLAGEIKRIFIRLAAEIATLMVFRGTFAGFGGMGGLGGLAGPAAAGGLFGAPSAATTFGPGSIGAGTAGLFGTGGGGLTLGGGLLAGGGGALGGSMLSGMLGLGKTGGTIGGGGGALAGAALGSIIPGVGTLIGGLAGGLGGSLLGGGLGKVFGNQTPQNRQGGVNIGRGGISTFGGGSRETREAVAGIGQQITSLLEGIEATTGRRFGQRIQVGMGERDPSRVRVGRGSIFDPGTIRGPVDDVEETLRIALQEIARQFDNLGGLQQRVLKRSIALRGTDIEAVLQDVQLGQTLEELRNPLTEAQKEIRGINQHFNGLKRQARELGLATGLLERAQRQAVTTVRERARAERMAVRDQARAIVEQMRGGQQFVTVQRAVAGVVQQFKGLREEARALGLDTRFLNRLQRQAVQATRARVREERRAAIEQQRGIIEQQRQAIGQAQAQQLEFFSGLLDPLRDFQRQLQVGPLSALDPRQQFEAAQRQFRETAQLAQGGDIDAIQRMSEAGQTFIEQAAKFGASPGMTAAVEEVSRAVERVADPLQEQRDRFAALVDLPDRFENTVQAQTRVLSRDIGGLKAELREQIRELRRVIRKTA